MSKELKYILAILQARFKDDKMVFGMEVKSRNDKWETLIYYGIPETNDGIFYIGVGRNEVKSLESCLEKVLLDKRFVR